MQNPVAERHDESGSLGDGQEVDRRNHAEDRVPPSHQRLESQDLVRRERDDRLVEEFELTPLQRRLEVAFQLQLRLFGFQNRGVEDLAVRTAQHLCTVQRGLGVVQHVVGLRVTGRADGDADARRQPDLTSTERKGFENLAQHAIRDDLCVADLLQAVEQDGEIVTVHARDEIVVPHAEHRFRNAQGRFQASGDRRQERIAGGLAGLPAGTRRSSQIDDQHREVETLVAARTLDGMRDAIDEQQAIGQPGDPIGHHLHGDVRVRTGQTDGLSGRIADDRATARHPAIRAVLVA